MTPPSSTSRSTLAMIAMLVLLALATWLFAERGVQRALAYSGDFATLYSATRAWMEGRNPYDAEVIHAVYQERGGPPARTLGVPLNLPFTFPLVAPLGALSWTAAKQAWLGLNLALLAFVIVELLRQTGLRAWSPPGLALVAVVLAFAPMHTGLAVGQAEIIMAACLLAALRADLQKRDVALGIALALLGTVKPQVLALFALFYVCRRRWTSIATTAGVMLALMVVATAWLAMRDVAWIGSWGGAVHEFMRGGGLGDPTSANVYRYQMINLHYPMHLLFESRLLVEIAVPVISLGLAWYAWALDRETSRPQSRLVIFSVIIVASLMMTYHRAYDAFLLILPIAIGLLMIARHREDRRQAVVLLALIAPFLVPGAAALRVAEEAGRVPEWLAGSWAWHYVLVPHQAWALLGIAIWLTWHAPVMVTYTFGRYAVRHGLDEA